MIGYLLRGEPESRIPDGQASVELPTRKSIIASRLNLTPEHFSRILNDLAQSGLVRVRGRKVDILDIERLRTHQG